MKTTWVYIDGVAHERQPSEPQGGVMVMGDIQPYQSMIDGSMITSRSTHRDHLRAHGCIEVGNEKMANTPPPQIDTRREILREQLANMTHDQANKILAKLRDDARFTNHPHREK